MASLIRIENPTLIQPLGDLAGQIEDLVARQARRVNLEIERRFQQLRNGTLSSGAMPGEFTLVGVYRRGELLRPEIR